MREARPDPGIRSDEISLERILNSDKVKYQRTVSPDKTAKKLKQVSEKPVLGKLHDIMTFSEATTGLWDEAYFVETIG